MSAEAWHTLEDHLRDTAARAEHLASKFNSGAWGHYAGLWHDLGKFSIDFQQMLLSSATEDAEFEGPRTRVNHSSAGALRAWRDFGEERGLPLAFVIAGHHSGLYDVLRLQERLKDTEYLALAEANGATAEFLQSGPAPTFPDFLSSGASTRSYEFWIRMLFSALIDADRLDTEKFHSPEREEARRFISDVPSLNRAIGAYLRRFELASPTPVNKVRSDVLGDCLRRAVEPQGVFTLTVPTGGGKTLASMAFALAHAQKHRLERIIVVIPYTSIIEQSASVFRDVFGDNNVVEHHSTFDPPQEPSALWLATENWDAPIIVTTTVQFFESLFANRTSAARKLHSLCRSVIIFDEVQTLPPGFLRPIVDALHELSKNYRATLVFTTATQPALRKRPGFAEGFENSREIIERPEKHFAALRRVDIHWPEKLDQPVTFEELALRILNYRHVLTIVHLRDDARRLVELLGDSSIHLSALMCPKHRSLVLSRIKARLSDSKTECRVVATQLVEAGVDIDFPVVFRALAGLDSIAQAAGRCNREGKLRDKLDKAAPGQVEVFLAPTKPPVGVLQRALAITLTKLRESGGSIDLNEPNVFQAYFTELYAVSDLDQKAIETERANFNFRTVAERFKLIENDWQQGVIVPYDDECRAAIADLKNWRPQGNWGPSARRARTLQQYSVNVPRKVVQEMTAAGVLEDLTGDGGFLALTESAFSEYYDERFGLDLKRSFRIDPEDLIA